MQIATTQIAMIGLGKTGATDRLAAAPAGRLGGRAPQVVAGEDAASR